MNLQVTDWGEIDYTIALQQQQQEVLAHRQTPERVDQLMLLEHPPTYTLGRSGSLDHLLLTDDEVQSGGFSVHHVSRGGDITYHGPGQLVGYPILNLKRYYAAQGFDAVQVRPYVRTLEQIIMHALAGFGIEGWQYPGYTGVWVGEDQAPRKIAAIGIHINSKGISSHGFALNVNPNMAHFGHIIPCGIQEHAVTSMHQEIGRPILTTDLHAPIINAFQAVMGFIPIARYEPSTIGNPVR